MYNDISILQKVNVGRMRNCICAKSLRSYNNNRDTLYYNYLDLINKTSASLMRAMLKNSGDYFKSSIIYKCYF